MNTTVVSLVVLISLIASVFAGTRLRAFLPAHHLSAESKDTVKLAMGLVATMAALLLGLLVSSAKGTFDNGRTSVAQMAAKVAFLDRVLAVYGPDAAGARAQLRTALREIVGQLWPGQASGAADVHTGDAVFQALHDLTPRDDAQRTARAQAVTLAIELAQLRALLVAQSVPSIPAPLLVAVVLWLVVIFVSFGLLSPSNATATIALVVSAISVAGAVFLILELDQPFGGLARVSGEPLLNALNHISG